MRVFISILISVAACAGNPTSGGGDDTGGKGDNGGDTGSGTGSGNGSGTGSGTNTGGGITATQYLTQMDQKDCDEAFACMASFPTDAGETFAQAFGTSAQDCYAQAASYDMAATVESEITAGKIHFDPAGAAACVASIMYGTCADYWANGPMEASACDTAMVGTVADGGACVVDDDCSNVQSICTSGKCAVDTGQ
jgi:hypothetical protein